MAEAVDVDSMERLESLSSRIQEAKDRHRLGDALDAAIRAVNAAESSISRLEQLVGFTALVGDFLEALDLEQCHRLLSDIQGVGQHLSKVSDTATLQDAAAKVSQLQGQVLQADGLLHRAWRTKIQQAFAATGQLGSVLREISETQQLGSEMESLIKRADHLAASLDDAERSTGEFNNLTTERDQSKEKLAELGAGSQVVDFLLAVADQSATLASVTEEVRDWLDEGEALARFKVGL